MHDFDMLDNQIVKNCMEQPTILQKGEMLR